MTERKLTIRVGSDLARQLQLHRKLTGETTNALVVRLLVGHLSEEAGAQRDYDNNPELKALLAEAVASPTAHRPRRNHG